MKPSPDGAWFGFDAAADAWVIRIYVQPGASRTEVAGVHGNALKLRIHAPPVEGRANTAVARFLSERLHVPPGRIALVRGATSRTKTFVVRVCPTDPGVLLHR